MKYRFRLSIPQKQSVRKGRPCRLKGRRTLGWIKPTPLIWEEPPLLPPPRKVGALIRFRRSLTKAGSHITALSKAAVCRMAGKRETITMLWGTLCAALAVTLVTGTVFALWLFGPYLRTGSTVTVPNCLSQSAESVLSVPKNGIVYELLYRKNDAYPPGTVISQTPSPGVVRRIYGKEDAVTVTLTVAEESPLYTLPDLAGVSQRDAALVLRQAGMKVTVTEEYSETEASRTVLRIYPPPGEHLASGSEVTLFVSKGPKIRTVTVPELRSLSETAASRLTEDAGLRVGAVSYLRSDAPVGSVISQSAEAGSTLPEGSELSFTVSLGNAVALKTIPDLTGLTAEQASLRLREVGLTVGSIHYVLHAAPSGTVIAQTPQSGSAVTSAVTSVDLTVSL
ncbi:MAG: PASTA domain-containing protein [Clostridia bacterium]|nr:PASTA domain-containing protein [Clostridia bacterium]